MTRIARPSLAAIALGAALTAATGISGAAAQVNKGVGIGPSSELERPDLQQQQQRARSPVAKRRTAHPVRLTTEKATKSTGAPPPH